MIPQQEQAQLDQLDNSLHLLFQQLGDYSAEQLNRQPAPEVWSPLMVTKHMMLAEGQSVKYLQKKLSFDPVIDKAGLLSRLRSWVLDLYFRSPIRRKAPEAIGDDALQGPHDLENLRTQWLAYRSELRQLLATVPPARYQEEVYKHPIVGRLSLSGMLQFFQGHFDRHRRQIESRLNT